MKKIKRQSIPIIYMYTRQREIDTTMTQTTIVSNVKSTLLKLQLVMYTEVVYTQSIIINPNIW